MTLLIACLLIYHYDMAWWWYAIAGTVWAGHLFTTNPTAGTGAMVPTWSFSRNQVKESVAKSH